MPIPDMWVVYDHPRDMPHSFVARRWINGEASPDMMIGPDLELIRTMLEQRGLTPLCRNEEDDPVILETWI